MAWQQGQWFNYRNFSNDLLAGIMSAVLMLLIAISLSTLVCGATLTAYLSQFITIFLASAAISGVIYAIASSFPNVGVATQDVPAVLTALVAIALYQISPIQNDAYFITVYMAMFLISIGGGLFMLLLGYFQQGNIVRFIPYPVVSGFLAGMGWLIFIGAWSAILGKSITFQQIPLLLQFPYNIYWGPAALLALSLLYFSRRYSHPLVLPVIILSFLFLFFAFDFILMIIHHPMAREHLFLGPFPRVISHWPFPDWTQFHLVNWYMLWQVWDKWILVFVLAPIAILINAASFEVLSYQEVNFNRELTTSGVSGVIAPFLGGSAWGYISVAMSFLNYKIGGRYRIINLIAAAIIAVILLKGSIILNYIPRFLAPGILMFVGADFLIDWLYKPAETLSRKDYYIVILIFITIITTQLAYGIILGIAISLLKFAWEYSQVDPIDGIYYGQTLTSHVIRGYEEAHLLDEHGSEICLVRLHGHLFFGNVYRVFLQIQQMLNKKKSVHYLVFDFSAVDGVDSSCRNAIHGFLYKAKQRNITILTVGLFNNKTLHAEKELQGSGLEPASDFSEVNDALEWCEQALLAQYKGKDYHSHIDIKELQIELALTDEQFAIFISFWDGPKTFAPGEIVIQQKDESKDIYFLTRGIMGIKVYGQKGRIGVANIHTGSIFGEVAYYTNQARMSDVECMTESEVYSLPFAQLQYMEEKYPKLALRLHRYIARQMTEKIKYFNTVLQAMLHHH